MVASFQGPATDELANPAGMFRPGLSLPTLSSFLLLSALLIVSNLYIQRLSSARSHQFGRKMRAFTGNITRERPEHAACGVFMIDRASRRQNVSSFAFRAGMPADPRSCGPSSVQDQGPSRTINSVSVGSCYYSWALARHFSTVIVR
jgi:hypothetical protein